jgi:hypothetical protein
MAGVDASAQLVAHRAYDALMNRSRMFYGSIPAAQVDILPTSNRMRFLVENGTCTNEKIVQMANGVHPLVHRPVFTLIKEWLNLCSSQTTENEIKTNFPCNDEDTEEDKEETVRKYILRLLTKRPVCFYGRVDQFMCREGVDDFGDLKEYISYQEMSLSAMLSVEVPTFFINDGGRHNNGIPKSQYPIEGVYVASVGARFEVPDAMERRYLTVQPNLEKFPSVVNGKSSRDDTLPSIDALWHTFYNTNVCPILMGGTGSKYFFKGEVRDDAHALRSKSLLTRLWMVMYPFVHRCVEIANTKHKNVRCIPVGIGSGEWNKDVQWNGDSRFIETAIVKIVLKVCSILNPSLQSGNPRIETVVFPYFFANMAGAANFRTEACLGILLDNVQVRWFPENAEEVPTPDSLGPMLDDTNDVYQVVQYAWDSNR